MQNEAFLQQSHQNQHKSTTVWTQPQTLEQKAYYSKHAAERRVFGWISAFLQLGHGILAFASFSAIYSWVLQSVPSALVIVPFASAGTLMALHILFRTTWQTYWYDRLDDDPNTDSPLIVPALILLMLFILELNGATLFLKGQVKPPEKTGTEQVEKAHIEAVASIDEQYNADRQQILAIYAEKSKAAAAPFDRQIRALNRRKINSEDERRSIRAQISALESKKDQALEPVLAAKAADLEQAYRIADARKKSEGKRRDNAVTMADTRNSNEEARHQTEINNASGYAWLLSLSLLSIISLLLYRMVKINVKSGILPLRNYTVLDAHGSVMERLWTAFSDAFNRRGLQAAVAIHRTLSPSEAITSFDGTVVAVPGTYNTPEGFFNSIESGTSTPPWAGPQKHTPPPSQEPSYAERLAAWAKHFQRLIQIYDDEMAAGRQIQAKEQLVYINSADGPIVTGARELGVRYGIVPGQPEVMVWKLANPEHKVPLSKVSEDNLAAPTPSSDSPEMNEEEDLFKQSINMFKQTIQPQLDDKGRVIGVKYLKRGNEWVTYPLTQVQAFVNNYTNRATKKPTPANLDGLEKWKYALSLFGKDAEFKEIGLEPVRHA